MVIPPEVMSKYQDCFSTLPLSIKLLKYKEIALFQVLFWQLSDTTSIFRSTAIFGTAEQTVPFKDNLDLSLLSSVFCGRFVLNVWPTKVRYWNIFNLLLGTRRLELTNPWIATILLQMTLCLWIFSLLCINLHIKASKNSKMRRATPTQGTS